MSGKSRKLPTNAVQTRNHLSSVPLDVQVEVLASVLRGAASQKLAAHGARWALGPATVRHADDSGAAQLLLDGDPGQPRIMTCAETAGTAHAGRPQAAPRPLLHAVGTAKFQKAHLRAAAKVCGASVQYL